MDNHTVAHTQKGKKYEGKKKKTNKKNQKNTHPAHLTPPTYHLLSHLPTPLKLYSPLPKQKQNG